MQIGIILNKETYSLARFIQAQREIQRLRCILKIRWYAKTCIINSRLAFSLRLRQKIGLAQVLLGRFIDIGKYLGKMEGNERHLYIERQ